MVILWVVTSFDYYLIGFQMKYIKGNIYNNVMISSASEIFAYIGSGFLLTATGIRFSFFSSFSVSLLGGITYLIFGNTNEKAIPAMILGAKFGVASTFNLIYLANAFLFPPILNSTSFGICNMFARLATILAPQVAELEGNTAMIVFCILAGTAALSSLFLIKLWIVNLLTISEFTKLPVVIIKIMIQ